MTTIKYLSDYRKHRYKQQVKQTNKQTNKQKTSAEFLYVKN